MIHSPEAFGEQLRAWRRRRRMSQLDLACEAEISTRHLSFVETGRSAPSREMVLRLAESLEAPPRETNLLLTAAGFAPSFPERGLDHPAMAAARQAIELLLAAHAPFPALAVDRHWNLISANAGVTALMSADDPSLLQPPINVLRLSLHPDGLGGRIVNYGEWRAHTLERLAGQVRVSADPVLSALHDELVALPWPAGASPAMGHADYGGIAVPFQIRSGAGVLSFFSTTTVFGTPVDVTLSEIAIETFLPADEATTRVLRG
jgi:transcriptional regulator with XRE-family HTH domain